MLTPATKAIPDWNRIISGAFALLWLSLCGLGAGIVGLFQGLITIVLPMACIWFPDELGSITRRFLR